MTTGHGVGASKFESKLARIVESSETEEEEQSGLMLELVREVHAIKVLLLVVLVFVPVGVLMLAIAATR
jgi:hypothetical protein